MRAEKTGNETQTGSAVQDKRIIRRVAPPAGETESLSNEPVGKSFHCSESKTQELHLLLNSCVCYQLHIIQMYIFLPFII